MIQQTRTVAAIDVGTTKIFCLVARQGRKGELEVAAHGLGTSQGVRKGNVVDVETTRQAIRRALAQVEERLGGPLREAYVGITGAHVSFQNRWDTIQAGDRGVITARDISQVPHSVAETAQEEGRTVIHALPISYSLDGRNGIRNPLGMHSRQLQVESHVVTASQEAAERLRQAVEGAGIRIRGLVLEPLADALALLTPREMETGVALIDVGGGTTDLVVFKNGAVRFSAVIPVGGFHFTNDIAVTYGTPYEAAEKAKLEHATTEAEEARPDEDVFLPIPGKRTPLRVARRDICQLVRERGRELVRIVAYKLRQAGVGDVSDLRLVLTGGACTLPGLEGLFRRGITTRVRVGAPDRMDLRGLPEELKGPAYTTGVGLLLWAAQHNGRDRQEEQAAAQAREKAAGNGGALSRLVRKILPR